MTLPPLSCAQVRALEERCIRELGLPSLVLMENAGREAAEVLLALGCRGGVLVCCGKGNNGGDGLVLARHLDNAGVPVSTLVFAHPEELSPDAAVNFHVAVRSGMKVTTGAGLAELAEQLPACEWVVDGLFGTGLKGPLREPFDAIIAAINGAGKRVLALDIPSGLDGDTGQPLGAAIRAEQTTTFLTAKRGLVLAEAESWVGRLHVVDIGLPRRYVLTALDQRTA